MQCSESGPLLYVNFNQDNGCFACGLTDGFRIFNTAPVRESFRRVFGSGIGIVEMLFRCNLLALVGGGPNPRYPANKVMIWDDHQNRCIGELVFKSPVKSVRLRRDRIIVALHFKVYIYRFSDLKLLDQFGTMDNARGILAVCYHPNSFIVATLGNKTGEIFVKLYDSPHEQYIQAHSSDIACIALSTDGKLLASASEKGTLIRIWETSTGSQISEYRRGIDVANILSLSFNATASYLMCSSDKGTIHVFSLPQPAVILGNSTSTATATATSVTSPTMKQEESSSISTTTSMNKQSYFKSMMPSFLVPKLQYLDSQWSFLQLRGIGKCYCGFNQESTKILVLTAAGMAYTYSFTSDGKAYRESSTKFINNDPTGSSAMTTAGTKGGPSSKIPHTLTSTSSPNNSNVNANAATSSATAVSGGTINALITKEQDDGDEVIKNEAELWT